MTEAASQRETIAFLSRPDTYGLKNEAVERVETHGAIVFLAGERAYKLKRAVKFPYMDYSTIEKRRAMCVRELEINRCVAAPIYLEVRTIMRGPDGNLRFGAADAPGALDAVVVMRRFDQETLFGRLCEAGKLTPELMRQTAEAVAAFHAKAEITRDFGGADGFAAAVRENNSVLASMIGAPFAADQVADFGQACDAALRRISPLLDRRREKGLVRRCHGDLHLNNLFLLDGRPMLFDALEFEDNFACIDVLYDLAFLLMDLEHHGARAQANTLFNRYLEIATDYEGLAALPLFLGCRAVIRAHVSVSRAAATGGAQPALHDEALAYFDLARDFLRAVPPRLVVVGGLSGTGKTTLARLIAPAIGRAPGAVIIRSDVTRKRLMGVPETARLAESAYTPEVNVRVFAEMARTAATILAAGHAVVMDAVYGTQAERAEIASAAAKAGAPFDGLWLQADPAILAERISVRSGDASDATVAVLQRQLAAIPPPGDWTRIDASGTREMIASATRVQLKLHEREQT